MVLMLANGKHSFGLKLGFIVTLDDIAQSLQGLATGHLPQPENGFFAHIQIAVMFSCVDQNGRRSSAVVLADAVEPNREMRMAAEKLLSKYAGFKSVDGTAETTGLATDSVAMVSAAQAFHWFNRELTKGEFSRILKRDGWVVLIWNDRKTRASEFSRAYEEMLNKFSLDYQKINHKNIDERQLRATIAIHK